VKLVRTLQQQLRRSKASGSTATPDLPAIQKLVEAGTLFKGTKNGHSQLSMISGVLVRDLTSHCEVSMEKLPLVIILVLFLVLGDQIDDTTIRRVVRSSDVYALSAERASVLVTSDGRARFCDRERDDGVQSAILMCDESNKAGMNICVKQTVQRLHNGDIVERGLATDSAVGKKSAGAVVKTVDSLTKEFTRDGLAFVHGSMSDAFNGARKTNAMLIKICDEAAVALAARDPTALRVQSAIFPGLVFDTSGPFREECANLCKLHNLDKVTQPVTSPVLGPAGCKHDASPSQCTYAFHWICNKARDIFDSVILECSEDAEHPEKVKLMKLIKQQCASRWLTYRRSSDELWVEMNVPASPELLLKCATYFASDWDHHALLCRCFDGEGVSHLMLMLMLLWVANHSTANISSNAARLVGFLASPLHRICLRMAVELYPIHLHWAAFYDGKSGTHPSCLALSCRSLEVVPFERELLWWTTAAAGDWRGAFPQTVAFMHAELDRAALLDLPHTREDLEVAICQRLSCGMEDMASKARKYFIEPTLKLGSFLLLATDPSVAPDMAVALLLALKQLYPQQVLISGADIQAFLALAPVAATATALYTLDSSVYAYPGLTHKGLRNILKARLLKNPATTRAIALKYGLLHPRINMELWRLARGELQPYLVAAAAWVPGMGVRHYWSSFELFCPALAHFLEHNHLHKPQANGRSEQLFSVASSKCKPTACHQTNSDALQHHAVVRQAIVESIVVESSRVNSALVLPKADGLFRNKEIRIYYVRHLVDMARALDQDAPLPSAVELRGAARSWWQEAQVSG
ncbi:hypothetical protein B484DRAFT_465411, partial [Ochromonadaceae sp. CCMP2298]